MLGVDGVGVLLAHDGALDSVALASDESVYGLCALEAGGAPGPAAVSLDSGEIVRFALGQHDKRWPAYADALRASGGAGVIAIPADDGEHPGAMLLCQRRAVRLSAERLRLAGILATLLIETAVRGQAMRHLQAAIDSLGATMRRIDEEAPDDGVDTRG
ncbi:hypothetical protein KDK95_02080 [Actinospica sp. MGRD01-02]|uniref:GAF domain-containing protein n=1 Tax=Actinospica acidithermotolerans TaxID=2828514 RepID=A0A941E6Z1_9ACTN|nr:hypothetical protein [Actinospica acidithermotolerans]